MATTAQVTTPVTTIPATSSFPSLSVAIEVGNVQPSRMPRHRARWFVGKTAVRRYPEIAAASANHAKYEIPFLVFHPVVRVEVLACSSDAAGIRKVARELVDQFVKRLPQAPKAN